MSRRPLIGETVAPAALDEAALREAWRFRGGFADLKPTVAPEDDYRAFCATLRRGALLWQMRDENGGLRAMIMAIVEPGEHAGRGYVHLEFEYAFFDPAFRRSFASRLLFTSTIARTLAQAKGRPVYLVASTYPAGATSLGVEQQQGAESRHPPNYTALLRKRRWRWTTRSGSPTTWESATRRPAPRRRRSRRHPHYKNA